MITSDYVNTIVSEGNEAENSHKGAAREKSTPGSDIEKPQMFGNVYRMHDSQKMKSLIFDTSTLVFEAGWPHTVLVDDTQDWYRASIQELNLCARDKTKWNKIINDVLDSNGC